MAVAGHGFRAVARLSIAAVLLGASAVTLPLAAQQSPSATKKAPPAKATEGAEKSSEPGGRSRLDQLEQQMVDMQVAIGTLESLSRGGGGGAGASPRGVSAGIEAGRVDALETQVRALAAQVDQLSQQIRQMQQARGPAPAPAQPLAAAVQPPAATQATVAPGASGAPDNDPIGRIIGSTRVPPQQTANAAVAGAPQSAPPPSPPIASDAAPKQVYEQAYGYLLAQDYGSAEAGFDEFLKRFPQDPLAGNAQYWLGETYFVRGQYKPAAAAFLKGYQTYAKNAKAPDSLLKLAMSLERLGQKDAACASFGELTTKFPTAPAHIKNRADSERRRLACA